MGLALGSLGLAGALVGSFLNVVIQRVPRRESIVKPRSRCPGCGETVAARDNVPLASWLVLRGRCRACSAPIPLRYPLVELLTALTFVAVVAVRGVDLELAIWLPLAAVLIALAAIDLEHRIVPNRIVAPAAVWALGTGFLLRPEALPELVAAGAAAFLFLLAAALIRPGGMGMGDVKLAGVIGLYLGWSVAPALLAALLGGSLVGLALIARRGPSARKLAVPFAPFLAAGGVLGILAGPQLVGLYLDISRIGSITGT